MIQDIATVAWKEWKEWLVPPGKIWSNLGRQLFLLAVLGIFLPMQLGVEWLLSAAPLIYAAWTPTFVVVTLIADSFAGERERHTLETLLASRLPDDAILWGKVVAAVAYGCGLTLAGAVLGAITANVLWVEGTFIAYPPATTAGIIILSLLGALLATGAGVLVSLRAATVKAAQQTLSIAMMLLILGPILLFELMPRAWVARLSTAVAGIGAEDILPIAATAIFAVDVVLVIAMRLRFRRTRLLLP